MSASAILASVTAGSAPSGPAPAGGAALDQILIVVAFTTLVYAALAYVMWQERRRIGARPGPTGRAAERLARLDGGSPRWFLAPMLVQVAGALSAAVGLYWDVSFHISQGRDEGPLANPAHYLIFFGLIGMFLGGALALALADDRLPERTVRITRGWRVPVGPALSTAVALCALAGFPLDDVWHRLFGQDVTEWGPTHLVMIGGTILLPYSMLLTCAETRQLAAASRMRPLLEAVALVIVFVGPVAFLLEYAFGTPQFPLVMDPIVLAIAASLTMTLAMLRGRRWVVSTWLGFVALQAGLLALNVWVFGALPPVPSMLVGGALAGLLLTSLARATYGFAVPAGAGVAIATLAVEYLWAQLTRPMPWPVDALPVIALWGAVVGAAAGAVAVWLHTRLVEVGATADRAAPRPEPGPMSGGMSGGMSGAGPRPHLPALLAAVVLVGAFAYNAPPRDDVEAGVTLAFEPAAGDRAGKAAYVRAEVEPSDVADRAWWFETLSWQGGGAVRAQMQEVSPGVYRTSRPVPVSGEWKTLLRLHLPAHTMVSAPIYLPADPAIPAAEVPAVQGAERDFVTESHILRREERQDVPGWLWLAGYVVTFALFGLVFALIAAAYVVAARRPGLTRPAEPTPSALSRHFAADADADADAGDRKRPRREVSA